MIGALRTAPSRLYDSFVRSARRVALATTRPDPWRRYPFAVPLRAYGAGASHPFSWYFNGRLSTPVQSLDEATSWLLDCRYRRDLETRSVRDHWQHPVQFEQAREGDCEDFSLWAWRVLVELGHDAEFVAGWSVQPCGTRLGHAWVQVRQGDSTLLIDPVVRDRCRMVQPLDYAAAAYLPQVSVDRAMQRYVYGGYLTVLRERWQPC